MDIDEILNTGKKKKINKNNLKSRRMRRKYDARWPPDVDVIRATAN